MKNIKNSNEVIDNVREFSIGDRVLYKPYENCRLADVSDPGIVEGIIGGGMYEVRFGLQSIHGTRLGKYCWVNLWVI